MSSAGLSATVAEVHSGRQEVTRHDKSQSLPRFSADRHRDGNTHSRPLFIPANSAVSGLGDRQQHKGSGELCASAGIAALLVSLHARTVDCDRLVRERGTSRAGSFLCRLA